MKITPAQRHAWLEKSSRSPFNQWLDAQISKADGGLDIDRLHEVARRFGIDRRDQYSHLNAGQQRMNIGNMLRRVVPPNEYDSDAATTIPATKPASAPLAERPAIIGGAGVRELLVMHSQIMDELREREVVRTGNAPLGDYAELLFATAFGWALEGNSSAGHDAADAAGTRYQIKGRRVTPRNRSRQLSAIRRLPDQTFDFLAGIVFDQSYGVTKAILIPHAVVVARAKRVEHTNSWRFMLEDRVWQVDGTRDVTAELAQAAEQI